MSNEEDNSDRSSVIENDMVSLGAAESMTFFMSDGTDISTIRYLNLPRGVAYGIEIMPTVACSITEINGRTLKAALSVGTGGYRSNNVKITKLTITAGSATTLEITGKGGI
jgi:hypothetical protein